MLGLAIAATLMVVRALRTSWQDRIARIQEHKDAEPPYTASTYRQLRRDLLDV
ncbi:MAG: hypothetical protein M3319_16530 [Actinomycetota bacterium]|jgi:hypothetical protein|nr:hypothetical protein [Actinomycetota bacterium]MDQ3901975.1 hypothetical protein [Actinomycetota bacterium]